MTEIYQSPTNVQDKPSVNEIYAQALKEEEKYQTTDDT